LAGNFFGFIDLIFPGEKKEQFGAFLCFTCFGKHWKLLFKNLLDYLTC